MADQIPDSATNAVMWLNADTCIENAEIAYEDSTEDEDGPVDTVISSGDLGVLIDLARYAVATRASPPAMDREAVERPYRLGWLRGTNPDGWDEDDDVTHGDLAFDRQMREDLDSDYPAPSDADAPQTDKHHSVCGVHDDYDCDCAALRRAGVRDDVDAVTISALVRALEWYRDTVGQCRMMHSEGDDARNALHKDCGARANDALSTLSADAIRQGEGWRPIETAVLWEVYIVTDGVNAAMSQYAESDLGYPYWAVEPEDALEWEPTHCIKAPASHASDGGEA